MSLHIYKTADVNDEVSEDGTFTNPIRHSGDGRLGQVIERRYFVRNDSASREYTEITVTPVDLETPSLIDGTGGFSFKMRAGDSQPLEEEWDTISDGNSISIPNISDTTTFSPFWLRIKIPKGAEVKSYDDIRLRISCEESVK